MPNLRLRLVRWEMFARPLPERGRRANFKSSYLSFHSSATLLYLSHVRTCRSEQRATAALVDGLNVRDSRVRNYPPRWNAAPSQELLVIRRNHKTGEVSLDPLRWGLIPYWCKDSTGGRKPINAKAETVARLPTFREAYGLNRTTDPPRMKRLLCR